MNTPPPKRLRANGKIVEKLRRSLDAARAAADTAPTSRCAVDVAHREAMRLYMRSWVIAPLEDAIERMTGVKP
jgi:hypothetical protein